MKGKYLQALAALNAANKLEGGQIQVVHRVKQLKEKIAGVELRDDLKIIVEDALKKLETVQNGIQNWHNNYVRKPKAITHNVRQGCLANGRLWCGSYVCCYLLGELKKNESKFGSTEFLTANEVTGFRNSTPNPPFPSSER